jgi:hypothetical protein
MGNTQKATLVRRRYAPMVEYQNKLWEYKSRLNVAPDDVESYVKLGLLLLKSDEPLGVENYLNKAAQLHPDDPKVKAAQQQLEQVYTRELKNGLEALRVRNFKKADQLISRAMAMRPHDVRTELAVQQAREAAQTAAAPSQKVSVPLQGTATSLQMSAISPNASAS